MVYKSRTIVKCGHEGCFYEGQRRLLKRHTEGKHPGCDIKEYVNASSDEPVPVNTGTSVSNDRETEETANGETEETIKTEEDAPMTTRKKVCRPRQAKMMRRCKEKPCRSLDALKRGKNDLLDIKPEEDMVVCKACIKKNKSGSVGMFPYNFTLGSSFKPGEALPQEFKNLKFKITRHFASDRHLRNCKALENPEEEITDKTRAVIAMRCLRTAYYVIKSSRPHKEFCALIHLQTLNGMNMGDINHSTSLVEKLRDAIHDEIMAKIRAELSSAELSNDLRLLADITYARSSQSIPFTAKFMCEALARLKQRNILPPHIQLTELCCQKICYSLKEYKPYQTYVSNEELFKYAWDKSADPLLKTYTDLIVRLWLLNPTESMIESLGVVIKNVFGFRHLEQGNAVKELVIKWNGPPMTMVDPILENIQRRLNLKFLRITRRGKTDQGTVLSHLRKKQDRPYGVKKKKAPKKPAAMKKKMVGPSEPSGSGMPMNYCHPDKINRATADAMAMGSQMYAQNMTTAPPDQSMSSIIAQSISLSYPSNIFCT